MTISVCHLRKPLPTELTLVRGLPTVHVDVVLNIVKLRVRFAAVLAFEELVRPPGAEIGL